MTNISNERSGIITDSKDIRKIREYYEQFYANDFTYSLKNTNELFPQGKDNPNSLSIKEIGSVVNNLPSKPR